MDRTAILERIRSRRDDLEKRRYDAGDLQLQGEGPNGIHITLQIPPGAIRLEIPPGSIVVKPDGAPPNVTVQPQIHVQMPEVKPRKVEIRRDQFGQVTGAEVVDATALAPGVP